MPSRFAQVIIVCEDLQQRSFVYRFLLGKGFAGGRLRIEQCRGGDAKQFVRAQHAIEVNAMRIKLHLAIGVITVIDADDRTVKERKEELDRSLVALGQESRNANDQMAILVPRRNIESWIHALLGERTNETDEYPRFRGRERECAPAVDEFVRKCPGGLTKVDPPSLKDGCEEITQLLRRLK